VKVVCTIEARMTSTRLPGKVLLPARGRPLLEHMVERLKRARRIDAIVLAIPDGAAHEPLAALAARLRIGCFRGSEDDVLGRVLGAARAHGADLIVETTADCPLIDPAVVDEVVERFLDGGADYCSNTLERTFPDGMDVQVFPTAVLAEADALTADPADREHVSLYIYSHPERYRLRNVASGHPRWGDLRLTVDTAEDYERVRAIIETVDPAAGLEAIVCAPR
jgi:spore coat polysaccharide biosynthesis protein SpsF